MPNWCSNTVTLRHDEPAMITRAVEAINRGEFLNEFIPVPQALKDTVAGTVTEPEHMKQRADNVKKYGYPDWYDFCTNEWGTKWDVGDEGAAQHINENTVHFYFDSAWSPPVAAYEKLQDMGFMVDAMYYEPGMAYAGVFDEFGDECFQFDGMSSSEVRENIPVGLDAEFAISEQMEEWEKENEEELTRWYKDGVEDTGLTPHKAPIDE